MNIKKKRKKKKKKKKKKINKKKKKKKKKIEKFLENKNNTINLINNIINENMYYFGRNNYTIDNVKQKIIDLKKEYVDKKLINDIFNATHKLYLNYNYSFNSDEAKNIINYNNKSIKILYYWLKNVPKLIFNEHIKYNLELQKKENLKKYEILMQKMLLFFGVDSLEGFNY